MPQTKIEIFSVKQLYKLVNSNELKISIKKNGIVKGFYYFQLETPTPLVNENCLFLTAIHKENKNIEGILNIYEYDYKPSNLPKHWRIKYIDVIKNKREQGIASALYKSLNVILTRNDYLISTSFSHLARKINLPEKIERIMTDCNYFITEENFYLYCQENNLLRSHQNVLNAQ